MLIVEATSGLVLVASIALIVVVPAARVRAVCCVTVIDVTPATDC